jgi:REP element-mobilizing transposase RayT
MPHSYGKLLYHVIFSTKMRRPVIAEPWRMRLYPYMHGIVENLGGRLHRANGPADHVHLALELKNDLSVAHAVGTIKANSTGWIHKTFPDSGDFFWQTGYAAFTVSSSALEDLIRYIDKQEEHHRRVTFEEELVAFLKRHQIQYDERFLFD